MRTAYKPPSGREGDHDSGGRRTRHWRLELAAKQVLNFRTRGLLPAPRLCAELPSSRRRAKSKYSLVYGNRSFSGHRGCRAAKNFRKRKQISNSTPLKSKPPAKIAGGSVFLSLIKISFCDAKARRKTICTCRFHLILRCKACQKSWNTAPR